MSDKPYVFECDMCHAKFLESQRYKLAICDSATKGSVLICDDCRNKLRIPTIDPDHPEFMVVR